MSAYRLRAEVPPAVSARVTAALRSAPRPAVHTIARPKLSRAQSVGLLTGLGAAALWVLGSFYTVNTEERSVELLFGSPYQVGEPGLNFAPWPFVTYQVVPVTGERVTEIGTGQDAMDTGLMLTRDQNIVDLTYQVVWNVSNPEQFLFNLADPEGTIRAVAESAMRDIVARTELAPILNRDRGVIARDLEQAIQATLDSYQAGINVVRVNLGRADPPAEVIDSFREVQAAQQERDRLEKEADAYANRVLANARGEAAAMVEQLKGSVALAQDDAVCVPAATSAADGRSAGSAARHRRITSTSGTGTGAWMSSARSLRAGARAGIAPVRQYHPSTPRACTSDAATGSPPASTSGGVHPSVPNVGPGASPTRA